MAISQKIRREQKISQEKLAEKAGIHRTYMGKIEKGESNLPIHTVEKIAKSGKSVPKTSCFLTF